MQQRIVNNIGLPYIALETDPYIQIGGGYSYCPLRVGLVVRNPAGREVYCQPGDNETAMRETIAAFGEISPIFSDAKYGTIVDMVLGEYFA